MRCYVGCPDKGNWFFSNQKANAAVDALDDVAASPACSCTERKSLEMQAYMQRCLDKPSAEVISDDRGAPEPVAYVHGDRVRTRWWRSAR